MNILTITFDTGTANIVLGFSSAEKAAALAERIIDEIKDTGSIEPYMKVWDDYGRMAYLPLAQVMLVVTSDNKKELQAQQDIQLDQAHANLELNRRVQNDPVLKLMAGVAMARQDGPLPGPGNHG